MCVRYVLHKTDAALAAIAQALARKLAPPDWAKPTGAAFKRAAQTPDARARPPQLQRSRTDLTAPWPAGPQRATKVLFLELDRQRHAAVVNARPGLQHVTY